MRILDVYAPALSIAPVALPTDDTLAETDEQAIERLAALKPMQFDRVCKAEAKRMGVKASTLERRVKEARGEAESGGASPFAEIEPWAEPVDGAALLSDMARTIAVYRVRRRNGDGCCVVVRGRMAG